MFLTDADIERLTGYTKPKHQAAELERRGIPHFVNKRRQIVVTWAAVEAALGARDRSSGPASEPDLTVWN